MNWHVERVVGLSLYFLRPNIKLAVDNRHTLSCRGTAFAAGLLFRSHEAEAGAAG